MNVIKKKPAMPYSLIFKEAKRLHDLGFAIHWLHPRSKRPVESGWTTGPRKKWKELDATFKAGYNIGVRIGTPSKLEKGYLCVVDVDVKSADPKHLGEALEAVVELLGGEGCPEVSSGRGNGSRHYYCVTPSPFKTYNPAQSREIVKVKMPSKRPSKAELRDLSADEIEAGIRLSHAWEISLYSDGRQVVLPPSVHPDSGELYQWKRPISATTDLPVLNFHQARSEVLLSEDDEIALTREGENHVCVCVGGNKAPVKSCRHCRGMPGSTGPVREAHPATERSEVAAQSKPALTDFKVEKVDLEWLEISDAVKLGITEGKGVEDRSGFLLRASTALISAGLSQNEVLSVLTDPKTFLGAVGYEHAKTKDRARAAAWIYRYTFKKVKAERSGEGVFGDADEMPKARELSKKEAEELEAEFSEMRHWKQDIIRQGNGLPQKLVSNVVRILENEVSDKVVQRDEFSYRDIYTCKTPWGAKKGDIISDDHIATIKYWLGQTHGFEPPDTVISDALIVLATKNAFDPVKDFLESLPVWDEKQRLDTWLSEHFEAEGHPEYLAQVFRKWMVAMIVRVYHPGAKFDWMPIFEGNQGVGKSSFGRLLVGDKYFLDWLPNLNDKDSALGLQGIWAVELGELSQFRRNELESIKAFVTRTIDKVRPPYGRRQIESARRCVFFGTTNRTNYLTDETGNRRFKPVKVGSLDFDALRRDRLQLFSEAKRLFDQKKETEKTLDLTGEAKKFERQIHAEKMIEDDSNAMTEAMQDFIEKVELKKINFSLERFRILDLFEGVGPLGRWKPENRNLVFAAKMLKRLGGEDRFIQGRKFWKIEAKYTNFRQPPPTTIFGNDFEEHSFI